MSKELFAKNLKHVLVKKKLRQEDLAVKINHSRAAVGPWVKGTSFPKIDTLVLISDALNVPIDKLVRRDLTKQKV